MILVKEELESGGGRSGNGLCGGSAEGIEVGEVYTVSIQVTDEMVRKFAELTGDYNPIHLDDEYAKNTRYGRRIAHGMLSAGLISRALANRYGGGIYLSQTLKFLTPIFIGETVQVELIVKMVRKQGRMGFIETLVRKGDEICIKGEATIMQGERPSKSPGATVA